MRCALSLLALGLTMSGAAANPATPSGDALSRLVAGRTINIDTPLGTTVPIEYRDDGTLQGHAGAVAFYLGSMTDKGRWWVKGDRVCQRWTRWFDAEVSCMRFKVEGRRIHWQSDTGKSGTGTLSGPDPAQLRARAFALGGSQLVPKPVVAAAIVPATAAPPPDAEPKVASPRSAAWPTRIAGAVRPVAPTGMPPKPPAPDRAAHTPPSLTLQAAPVLVHQAVLRVEPSAAHSELRRAGQSPVDIEPALGDGLSAMNEAVRAAAEFRWCQGAMKLAHLPAAFETTGEMADEVADDALHAITVMPVEGSNVPGDRHGCFAVEPALMLLARAPATLR